VSRFRFNLLWYLGVVVMADLLPVGAFMMLHMVRGIGNLAPQIIASSIFFIILSAQAFLHLHFIGKYYPERGDKNIWSVLTVTLLAFFTLPAIIIALLVWATSGPVKY